jgi:hypothetical protein
MLRKALLLLAVTAVLAYAAATPPARGTTCSPANQSAILAAIPLCSEGCWTAKDCGLALGLGTLTCHACMSEMETNGLIGTCFPPNSNSWCLNDE